MHAGTDTFAQLVRESVMSAHAPSRRFGRSRYFRFGWERTLVNRMPVWLRGEIERTQERIKVVLGQPIIRGTHRYPLVAVASPASAPRRVMTLDASGRCARSSTGSSMSCGRGCPWRLLGEADLVGIFAHDFDGDQRGRGDLLPGISAVGEDASGAVASAPS
jgi:hypothetical protein